MAVPLQAGAGRKELRDVMISFRMTRSLVDKIEVYQEKYRKRVRTDAIIDLLEMALYIAENAERLDDPAMVKYFKENLYNTQLVDDIMSWPPDRVQAILGVLTSERERRIRLRIGR